MKIFLPFIFFIATNAFGATCTNTTRTNYSPNTVLTSSALNADFNQLVTKANAFDGGCVTDGTLEAASLGADFATVTNGIQQGCSISFTDANTLSVGKCILSVNGNFVKTAIGTSVVMACVGCSADSVSTTYYLYAKTGSTGSTLNLIISTTPPGADGYDASSNKVLGRFYNNSSSDIDQYSIVNWAVGGYQKANGTLSVPGLSVLADSFSFSYGTTTETTVCSANPCSYLDQVGTGLSAVTVSGTGSYVLNFSRTYAKIKCIGNVVTASTSGFVRPVTGAATNALTMTTYAVDGTTAANTYGTIHCEGY